MDVAVTGASGYIGSKLIPLLLNEGHSVRAIDTIPFNFDWSDAGRSTLHAFTGSIMDQEFLTNALRGVTALVHLAAVVPRGESLSEADGKLLWKTNYEATTEIVGSCLELGVNRLIFPSTCGVYEFSNPDRPATEADLVKPASLYARSKLEAERFVMESRGLGFDPIILRFATVFGPSPRFSLAPLFNSLLFEAVVKGKILLYGAEARRPLIHIDDVVESIALALVSSSEKTSRQIFNVGADYLNPRKIDLAEVIKKYVGGLDVEVMDYSARKSYTISTEKIKTILGFTATRRLEDGILEMISACKLMVGPR